MIGTASRLGIVLAGDRLVVAALSRQKAETFVVASEQPAATLRAELDARRLKTRNVAIGLPRSAVTVKPIELPAVGGDMRDMVRFELERHLPFSAEDAPFDFIPIPMNGDGPTAAARQVLVAAADRRVVDSAIRLADEAQLRPVSVTAAAHDLVSLVRPVAAQRVVWVHYAGDSADLLFLAGRTIALSRTVPAADETRIADEIRRSFPVTRWRACDAIWISGDAEPPGQPTATALTELGAPVTAPPYTPRAQRLLDAVEPAMRGIAQLAIAVAAGRRARPLDLIPDALRPRRLTRSQLITVGMAGLAVVLGLIALVVPGFRTSQHLAAVNADINRLTPEVRAVERVLQELESKRRLLGTIATLESGAVRPLPVLRELTELLPTDAWLTTVSLDAKGVELTGQAAAASTLIPLLENSPRFARVEFASPVTRGRDREQFRIRAAWETPEAATAAVLAGQGVVPAPPGATPRPAVTPAPPPQRGMRPGAVGQPAPPSTAPGVLPPAAPGLQPRRQLPSVPSQEDGG